MSFVCFQNPLLRDKPIKYASPKCRYSAIMGFLSVLHAPAPLILLQFGTNIIDLNIKNPVAKFFPKTRNCNYCTSVIGGYYCVYDFRHDTITSGITTADNTIKGTDVNKQCKFVLQYHIILFPPRHISTLSSHHQVFYM
jgi:hypothetical protein